MRRGTRVPHEPTEPALPLFRVAPIVVALLLTTGCAATIDTQSLEQLTAQALGRSVGQFDITERTEETGGRIHYTVTTRDGVAYGCHLYGVTGFQKAMSFGQIPNSDALCTRKVAGQGGEPVLNGSTPG